MKNPRIQILFNLICIAANLLHANEGTIDPFLSLGVPEKEKPLSQHIPTYTFNALSTFNPYLPKINVITGEYCETDCDLVVAGIEPISYRRFYAHLSGDDFVYGHWHINTETQSIFNFDSTKYGRKKNTIKTRFGKGEDNGNFFLYERNENNHFYFDSSKHKSFTHSNLSGQSHPLNSKTTYSRIKGKEKRYTYSGVLKSGNGNESHFTSDKVTLLENRSMNDPTPFPPYFAMIKEERRPNGNIIQYDYTDYNGYVCDIHRYMLKSITVYNSSRTKVLGALNIHYVRKNKINTRPVEQIHISGSDGRKAFLFHKFRVIKEKKGSREYDAVLDHVQSASKPDQNYNYRWEDFKHYFDHLYMFHMGQPEGRILQTDYDLSTKKAIRQNAPIGPNGEMCPIAQYEYHDRHTLVRDGENQKTIYRFNDDKRIIAVEKYDEDHLVSVERSKWNPVNGNLIRKTIEDDSGHTLRIQEHEYDKNHNVICQRIGDGKEFDSIHRTFSNDGFNLILTESDRPGKCICYAYVPGTNLLASEIVYHQNKIAKRTFHFYDHEISSVRIKTLVDDGKSENPDDLEGVTYRKILEFSPKRDLPCVGLTAKIVEKTLDTCGNEVLLKKVHYTYHPSGKVEREDHYDATNRHRYSLINEYDEKERVAAKTDALGHRITFEYDLNFNLITQDGPRPDKHKQWTYDRINRPIEEKERQADGSILTTTKQYDRCSRLIAQTDACGHETRYIHNGVGQLTKVIYPDGAVDQKEYDALGHMIKETDPNGYISCKEYNFRGQPTAIYHPDGTAEYFKYNENGGTLASHVDANATKTAYTYDLFDNPIKTEVFSPEGTLLAVSTACYSPFCKLSETDPEGNTTHYSYDFAGRLISKKIGERLTIYSYDALGNMSQTLEGPVSTTHLYNEKGELLEKKIVDCDGTDYFKEDYTYDEDGNQISLTTCMGTSKTTYNACGQVIQKTDPLGHTTLFSYDYSDCFVKTTTNPKQIQTIEIHDARGRLADLQVRDASNATIQRREKKYDLAGNQTHSIEHVYEGTHHLDTIVHEWAYGPAGRIEKVVEAGKKETGYLYDKAGRLKTIIKPKGNQIHHEYDAFGRVSRFYGDGIDYSYTYDRKGRLLKVEDHILQSTTNRVYDSYDNLIEETLASGLTIQSRYDPYGKRIALYLPDQSEVTYTYRGPYLYSVARKGYIHLYSERNLAGMPTQAILPNGFGTLSIQWDPLLRCEEWNSPYYAAKCTYDSVGNLIEYTSTDPLGDEKNFYAHDDLNQLISENKQTYGYDSLFNRTTKNENTYSLNSLCQVTRDGEKEFTYDENGNLISDGVTIYEYDLLDRLTTVKKGRNQTTYTYDAFNRRIAKDNAFYIWDGKQEIGMVKRGKVRELRILGEGLGAEIGSSVIFELGGYTYFPIHDIQGSLVTMMYTGGYPYGSYRYTAFGEQLTDDRYSPWRFASKRYDEETDLIYFGRRYYAPSLGRWITADPQGFDDGPNLYAYVHNSPFTTLDLHGLYSWRNAWTGVRDFGMGAGKHTWGMISGTGRAVGRMGEWMVADSFYEGGDPSYFHAKSRASYDGWKTTGSAFYHHPLSTTGEMFFPGVMETWRNPRSAENWGRAAVDVALIGLSTTKLGQASKAANTGRVGGETTKLGRLDRASKRLVSPRTPVGHSGKHLNILDGTHQPNAVRNLKYSGHAFDRMQSQGINPTVVENALNSGMRIPGKVPGTIVYHDKVNKLTVVTDSVSGRVITVDFGIIKQ
ncbi:MAG: hypothetical protein S4CHLAM2_18200 [Chlamydiales bacterium]|nr:hypothetical protein [Chlamydiales bacterium]